MSCEIGKGKGDKVETECEEPERNVNGDQSSDGILFITLFTSLYYNFFKSLLYSLLSLLYFL